MRIFTKRDAASKKQTALCQAISAEEQRKLKMNTLKCQTEEEILQWKHNNSKESLRLEQVNEMRKHA